MKRNLITNALSLFAAMALMCAVITALSADNKSNATQTDPLPSWNDVPAKQAIVDFVRVTTDQASPKVVPPEELKKWITTAKHPRYDRLYTELVYQPMFEVMQYLRATDYKTYIVTGGGQDFVRVHAEKVYGIPPEAEPLFRRALAIDEKRFGPGHPSVQVVGSALGTKYGYDKDGKPIITKEPKLLLNDNDAGKPEGIHLMIGRRPHAAFGNSTGDQQMLEYTKAGDGEQLSMLVLHDDAELEYAYGPAQGLPDTKVDTFTQALYNEAKKDGWFVISMKKD